MSTIELSVEYRCSDDCRMEGCPGHTATLTYQSTSDAYTFDINGQKIALERGAMAALLKLSAQLAEIRADAANPTDLHYSVLKERGWVPPEEAERLKDSAWRYEELSK